MASERSKAPHESAIIWISFLMAGAVAGIYAVWFLRTNQKVRDYLVARHVSNRVEDFLRKFP